MMNLPKKDQIQQGVDQRGLGPRLIDELFDAIDRSDDDLEFTVKVSFFEIYMERVHDLLDCTYCNHVNSSDINKYISFKNKFTSEGGEGR